MALGDPYATLTDIKDYLSLGTTVSDDVLNDALESVSREIENHTHRQFNQAASASERRYHPEDSCVAHVDDFHDATGLVVETDDDDDGTFETTWSDTDYLLEPLDGVVDGVDGWPFYRIKAVGRSFPRGVRPTVRVTALWGWSSVPRPVVQACLILASETAKLKDAPFGVAGFGDFGAVRVKQNPMAAKKLMPYVRHPVLVG